METSNFDEDLTTSLLEEVFDTVDSGVDSSKAVKKPPLVEANIFLTENNVNLHAPLRENDKVLKEKESAKAAGSEATCSENSLIQEDEIANVDDNDPFREGENREWITSQSNLNSSSQKSSNYFSDGTPKNVNKWSDLKTVRDKLNVEINKIGVSNGTSKNLLVDPIFHMHIINPKVSSSVLKEKMIGREAVPPLKISKYLATKDVKNINWVTGGAIVGKFLTKSQKGNEYCVWNLSDLNGDIKMISVLLFGSAFREYWKLSLGVVVGILNPSVLNNRNSKTEATLRVDTSDRIMVFGSSKDYGTCRSKKQNGENCTAVVNKSSCEYCIYHVKQVYDKASRRPELQASFTGSGLTNLRNKVLGKNEVFYGGKSYTAIKAKPSLSQNTRERERERMRALLAVPKDMTKVKKDKELLQRLNGEIKTKNANTPVSDTPEVQKPSKSDQNVTLKVDGESKTQKMIDLDLPVTNKQVLRAKANAIKFILANGPIKKPTNEIRSKKTPEQIKSIKRKLEAEDEEAKRMKMEDGGKIEKSLVKQKMERSGITEKFLEVMNSQAENPELLKEAESEEREKYFQNLEIREKMEEKMASTYKVECVAVRCIKCNYKSFSAAELCKKEKHPLKLVSAVKRFWKCGDCKARTVCLELVPLHSCKVCGSSKWERASMLPEKKAPLLPNEALSIRGHEEKFVGSVVRNPNINLLVPDES